MKSLLRSVTLGMTLLLLVVLPSIVSAADGHIVYLTWQQQPDTTMTVHWITPANETKSTLHYVQHMDDCWESISGSHNPLPEGHDEYLVHTAEITGLHPDTKYHFRLNNNTPVYSFRTMPSELKEPIRFVTGGDLYHDNIEAVVETNRQAAKTCPHFALLGGDIAYSAQKDVTIPEDMHQWLKFLHAWEEHMVTPEGLMVPILPTTSNEDTKGRYGQTPAMAPFFYALFSMPGKQGYNVLDFGTYMSIWLLDSGHTHPIDGQQSIWLRETLKTRTRVPYKFAVYHVPAYPSVRSQHLKYPGLVRKHWVPAFDVYLLTAAFEHHDHAYKRTHPIRNNRHDLRGTVYLGDGGWGVTDQRIPMKPNERWYLAVTAPTRHFHLITITPDGWKQEAIDYTGNTFDSSQYNLKQ